MDSALTEHSDLSRTMEDNHSTVSQSDTGPSPTDIQHQIMHLLTNSLSPALLQAFNDKLELLRKCSFHIKILLGSRPQCSANLPLQSLKMVQRIKDKANIRVRLQLFLLEELLTELLSGHEELRAIAEQKGFEENDVREKISWLLKMATSFEEVSIHRSLDLKYNLFPGVSTDWFPEYQLTLSLKMPVRFDRDLCVVTTDGAMLYWSVLEEDQQEPEDRFEIHYQLLDPTDKDDDNESGVITCTDYRVQVGSLLSGTLYEFRVKRVNCHVLISRLWTDTMVLRTQEDGGQLDDGSQRGDDGMQTVDDGIQMVDDLDGVCWKLDE